jgi:hypothetical protein
MSNAQIEGLVRGILMFAAGFAAQYGIDSATWAIVVSAAATLAGAAWSIYSNSRARMVEQVAKDPEVTKVVLESNYEAASIPSEKVVAHDPEADIGRS